MPQLADDTSRSALAFADRAAASCQGVCREAASLERVLRRQDVWLRGGASNKLTRSPPRRPPPPAWQAHRRQPPPDRREGVPGESSAVCRATGCASAHSSAAKGRASRPQPWPSTDAPRLRRRSNSPRDPAKSGRWLSRRRRWRRRSTTFWRCSARSGRSARSLSSSCTPPPRRAHKRQRRRRPSPLSQPRFRRPSKQRITGDATGRESARHPTAPQRP